MAIKQNGGAPPLLNGTGGAAVDVVEICAGAGGQALGLELAGFTHALAIDAEEHAVATLRANRPAWAVAAGDVTDRATWNPAGYSGVDLLAGGVPCPPFSIAGKQLGTADDRDLFAWAVELAARMQPRAVLLENVRGLAGPRFAGYRQHVIERFTAAGYWAGWRTINAAECGVPQTRSRFVLVALRPADAAWFHWPAPAGPPPTVGQALGGMMAAGGWDGAQEWAAAAATVAPTIVGGSRRHGGADLGPTRARARWAELGVDGRGVADGPPGPFHPRAHVPRLTCAMVARIQGWGPAPEYTWHFTGLKTARYRQIGNAFPPPAARAVGKAIARALRHAGPPAASLAYALHDRAYLVLRAAAAPVTAAELGTRAGLSARQTATHLRHLERDFELTATDTPAGPAYALGAFRGYAPAGT